jgi:amino acid transporter
MFGCFPAMFFIFDGFYTPTHTFNQMRRPSRGPASVCIGVVIITLIYILILVGMYLGSDGANNVSMVQFPE